MKRTALIYCFFLLMAGGLWAQQALPKKVSPNDFGLREATTGEERYNALYAAHAYALNHNIEVDYTGIDTLYLAIPAEAKAIPLPKNTDFKGLVLFVLNNTKHMTLFSRWNDKTPIEIDKSRLDNADFGDIEQLASGYRLLILNDQNPWVAERIGYGSPAKRNDILLLHEGKAENSPVAPWNTPATEAKCYYVVVDDSPKSIANLTMHRDIRSTFKTYCIGVNQENNLTIRNIRVTTPKSKLLADGVISIRNCANITVENVAIDGTYSKAGVSTGYGYGFSMNNDWNTTFRDVVADGNWGVFGTNCLSNTTLIHCDINRFDIHCYGRDARMVGCTFRNKQTQFSSMFGTVEFDSCTFIDCIPVRIRSSYNAYTPFDIVMKDCTFEPTRRYHALVNVMMLDTNDNKRPELKEKNIPNVRIENMTVKMPVGLSKIILYNPTGSTSECTSRTWHHLEKVEIEGLRTVRNGKPTKTRLIITDKPIAVERFECKMRQVELGGGQVEEKMQRREGQK